VSRLPDNFYARWRAQNGLTPALSEDADVPPERLLQAVWQHQRLCRDRLRTSDGKSVRVLHPGFISVEGGPDFRGAVIQIGDDAPRSGDVEVDIRTGGWRSHGHDKNVNFAGVILHVVWDGDAKGSGLASMATLPLSHALDSPLGELALWLECEPTGVLPEILRGKCSAPLRDLDDSQLTRLLHEAAQVRFQAKAGQFSARAKHAGWEQALWEGLFRALGYKHNLWPMHCLAETRARWASKGDSPATLQARLLGIGGLLPAQLSGVPHSGTDGYVRRLWDCWWRERDRLEDCVLPKSVWRFHGLRPANHPQRRLALASHWLAGSDLPRKLSGWCAADLKDGALAGSLTEVLQVREDDFWSWHWTIRSARLVKPQPLLGEKRVTDLAVNVILPWLAARAAQGGSEKIEREIERRYFMWPPAGDNSVLRLARQRLLGGAGGRSLRGAAVQQGLMQVVRDFCEHSNSVCDDCRFPELVRQFVPRK
jgi:hypothetical protein